MEEIEDKIDYKDVIKSISFDQKEIMFNIMKLHNNGKPFYADMTYSTGKFYEVKKSDKYLIPQPIIKLDVCPQTEDTIKIEPLGKLPFDDESIESLVIDLPFVVSPPNAPSMKNKINKKINIIANRFASFYPVFSLYEAYFWWISESYRVLKENGTCVFKCQNTISGGINHNTEYYSFMCAQHVGFVIEDSFLLLAKARLHSGKIKKQMHARKFTSTFFVFKKNKSKKYNKFNCFDLISDFSKKYT